MSIEVGDAMAEGWYDHDWAAPPELAELSSRGLLDGAAPVFNVGAHQGVVALMLARATEGRVVAVEASEHNARAAERNRELNDARNLEVVHAAGGETPGTVRFADSLNGRIAKTGGLGTVVVRAVTVDELAGRYGAPGIVTIDVEGFEGPVLRGARETIAQRQTSFSIEVHPPDRRVGTLADILAPLDGYELLWTLDDTDGSGYRPYDGAEDPGRFFVLALPSRPAP